MTPQKTLKQICALTESLVELSLSNEQNFPSTHGNPNASFEITVSNAESMSIALKNVSYRIIYEELEKSRCFNFKMLDGALISLRYRFQTRAICEHSLSYFPSPDLEHFRTIPSYI